MSITDDFNRSDANPIGGNWTTIGGSQAFKIVSNQAVPTTTVDWNGCCYTGATWNADQKSEVDYTIGSSVFGGPTVRSSTSQLTYYACYVTATGYQLLRLNNGSQTTLGNWSRTNSGTETWRIEVSGTGATVTLKIYVAGGLLQTYDDSDANRITSTDPPGLMSYSATTGIAFDNWVGTGEAAGTTPLTATVGDSVADEWNLL